MSTSIWFNKELNLHSPDLPRLSLMAAHLSIEWQELGPEHLKMSMPVDDRSRQPYGLLHGGASCALAETIGSIGSHLIIDTDKFICVGLEINANHIRSVREGTVSAIARPIHIGSSTHVWDIRISDQHDQLICISRLTVAILKKKP